MKKVYLAFLLSLGIFQGYGQNSCETAYVLTGENTVMNLPEITPDENGRFISWLSYEAPATEDKALLIKATGVSYLSWEGYAECPGEGYVEPLFRSSDVDFMTVVARGQKVILKSISYQTAVTSFDISTQDVVLGGADCNAPLTMTLGNFFVPANVKDYNGATWVTYTATETGEVRWSHKKYMSIEEYADCSGESLKTFYANYNGTTDLYDFELPVTKGNVYLWKFVNMAPLFIEPAFMVVTPGEKVSNALPATLGLNECTATRKGNHWYTYTPTQDCYLEISACNFDDPFTGSVSLYENPQYSTLATASACPQDAAGFFLRQKVVAGTTYYFNISTVVEANANFNFEIAEVLPKQGDECENPLVAGASNSYTPSNRYVWYSYTATDDKYISIKTTGADYEGNVAVYSTCSSMLYENNMAVQSSAVNGVCSLRFVGEKSQTYLIQFDLSSIHKFGFTIQEETIMPGDLCTLPIVLTSGDLVLSAENASRQIWYKYTAKSEGWLNIGFCMADWDETSAIAVKESCYDYMPKTLQIQECQEGMGKKYRLYTQAGQEWLIAVTIPSALTADITGSITETEPIKGELCSLAFDANLGTTPLEVAIGSSWYHFKTTQNGYYTFRSGNIQYSTSEESSSIRYKIDDCESPASNNIGFDVVNGFFYEEIYLEAEKDLYIEINLPKLAVNGSFTITFREPAAGEYCSKPIVISENKISHIGNSKDVWYSITFDKPGELEIGECGSYNFTHFSLYDTCPDNINETIAQSYYCPNFDGKVLTSQVGVQTYLLRVNEYSSFEMPMNFTATEETGLMDASGFGDGRPYLYPNPVKDKLTIEFKEGDVRIEQVIIYDLSGSEVKHCGIGNIGKFSVDTNSLADGVYIVSVKSSRGDYRLKIMVEK